MSLRTLSVRNFVDDEREQVREKSKEGWPEAGDASLVISFAARRRLSERCGIEESIPEDIDGRIEADSPGGRLMADADLVDFLSISQQAFHSQPHPDVLRRALDFMVPNGGESVESSFLKLFSAVESTLTFWRDADAYEILPREAFSELERDLKRWLKEHALLSNEREKRALIYEKLRELNRFPFSHVFKKFCQRYEVYLDDLWPLLGPHKEWPLLEIRHRLIHGDPFLRRPAQALLHAREHLRWTAERMLLSVLGWPLNRSGISPERLNETSKVYRSWPRERAHFA